jgi:Flp pilus assembly protein TadD
MHEHLARAAAIGVACLLQAACNVSHLAGTSSSATSEGSTSAESKRLIQLAGDVEARGDYDTAAALYARAAEAPGASAEARLRLGNAHLKVGNYSAAREAFAKVLAADANNPEALLGFGTAQLKSGEIESSVRMLAAAAPKVNTPSAYNRWGTALMMAGRPNEALEAFERAQSLAPNDLDVATNMALAQALMGRTDEAVAAMQAVAQSPLAQPRHRANLIMVLGIAGRIDEAQAVNGPDLSPAQKRDLLARARKVRDATTPPAKARAIGLLRAA